MRLVPRALVCSTAVLLLSAVSATAEPIRITSGSLVFSRFTIPVTLSGEGFTFNGMTDTTEGILMPYERCGVPECTAGTNVSLTAVFLGTAFHGATVTYNGETFTAVGSLSSTASMRTDWSGSLLIPVGYTGGVLTAPVSLAGEFLFYEGGVTPVHVPLVGNGTASLSFTPWVQFPGAFLLESLRYDISDTAAATPEPASLLLLATGAGALGLIRRRRATAAG